MWPGRAADHSPPSIVPRSWKSRATHPLGHTGPVTGSIYLFFVYGSLRKITNSFRENVLKNSDTLD